MAKVIAPLLTPPVAHREAPVPRTVSTSTSSMDVPVSPASSPTCAVAVALQPTLSRDAAPVTQRTLLSPRSPASLARNKVLLQSRSQQPLVSTPIDVMSWSMNLAAILIITLLIVYLTLLDLAHISVILAHTSPRSPAILSLPLNTPR